MMKIIITGANGSLGMNLVKYFSGKGHEIVATGQTEKAPDNLLKYADYKQIDLRREFHLPKSDVCIHAAALSDDKALFADLYKTNVLGLQNLMNALESCKVFIHVSSSSVYLPQDEQIKEEIAGKQNNKQLSAYGKSKLESEYMLQKYIDKFESVFVLRARAFYGAGDKMILPRLLKLVKNDVLQKPGSLDISISMTHYDNFCEAIDLCLKSDRKGLNVYNVADSSVYNMKEIVDKLTFALYGTQLPEKEIPIVLMKFLALFKIGGITKLLVRAFTQDMVLDIGKIKQELSYQGKVSLDDKIGDIVDWVQHIGGLEILKQAGRDLPWK